MESEGSGPRSGQGRVGLITHPSALLHDAGAGHPERAERIEAILRHLEHSGLSQRLEHLEPEPASRELIELAHEPRYVDQLERLDAGGGGRLDPDTRLGPHSLDAALRGSQGAVEAARLVLAGEWEAGFVLVRPPGHHATPDRGMGFCLTNHVAVAARCLLSEGASRVAIVDWDAHHGNGTQDIFWDDPAVFYVSLHQYPWYPGSGDVTEIGAGEGIGMTLNVPLPAGAGEDSYEHAVEDVVLPALSSFAPDLLFVSAGYDAHANDPLCMMGLTAGSFFRFTNALRGLGRGPVCVLEGGYDLEALAWSTGATISALLGEAHPIGLSGDEMKRTTGAPEAHRWVERAVAHRHRLTAEG